MEITELLSTGIKKSLQSTIALILVSGKQIGKVWQMNEKILLIMWQANSRYF